MKVQIKRLDSVTHNDTTATKLINDNFKAIQDEIELHLSRDGKEPNFMDADLDMNSHKIINSAYPTEDIDVATKEYVDDVAGHAAEYAAQASASAARAAVSEQHAAVYAQVAEDARAQVDGLINNDDFKAVAEDLQSVDSSIKKTANNIEDIRKAALLDPTSIENVGLVGEHINEILPITDHLNEIDTVSTNIDNVNRVAPHADKLSQLDDDVEQLLKQINGEGGLDSMVSGDNVTQASMAARGTARFATDSEAQTGTSTDVMITPKQLKQYGGGSGSSVDTYTKTEIDGMFNNVDNSIKELEATKANSTDLTDLSNSVAAIEEDKVNIDADNFTAIGKSTLAIYAMPSSRFIELTLGASDSTYTAPANGWYILQIKGDAGQFAALRNTVTDFYVKNNSTQTSATIVPPPIPAKKGETVSVVYNASKGVVSFVFIYAEGDK